VHDTSMAIEAFPKLSFEEFRQLPSDGKRYELVCGEVYVEASHAGDQVLTSNLFPGWRLPLRDLFDFRGRF
jgi:hypothetical protein